MASKTERLPLSPQHTLVIVPTADEGARIIYDHSGWEPDTEYTTGGPVPTFVAVSLDVFGFDMPG